jgi:ethanolaminephosphotransferase
MVVVLGGINTALCLLEGNNFHGFSILLLGSFPFYFSTLEEYYTDMMYLPIINGAVEGLLIVNGIFLFAGLFG